MRKKAITKPVFGKIFIVRFFIWVVIISVAAGYVLDEVYNKALKDQVYTQTGHRRDNIYEATKALYEAKPGSEEYDRCLNTLRTHLAFYQMLGYNYAEVKIGDFRMATDEDTAFFRNYVDEQNNYAEFFFIENISYLDPLNDFLKKNGMRDEKQYADHWYRFERDPLVEYINQSADGRSEWLKSVYVNREKHTFLPGVIRLYENGKEYLVDCTPADTKGYERIDFNKERLLMPAYRLGSDLSPKDIKTHTVPIVGGDYVTYDDEFFHMYEGQDIKFDDSWHIGYSGYRTDNIFVIAPFSSALIILIDLVAAAIVALVFAVIKYQKDKTVWKIFEYRVNTTEAMAHDLKTPLSTIMFYLENLEESSKDSDKVLEYTKNINDKIVTMDHMIGDILQFSRGESGKIDLNKESVSVKELITGSLKELPEMKYEVKGDDVTLTTDKKVFSQVIMNLLSNCDRYGKKGSVVDISIAPEALTITNKTDRAYDDVESLKKPFVKGDDSRGSKGAGLGLAIADNNLSMLGYKLELSSDSDEFSAKVCFKK